MALVTCSEGCVFRRRYSLRQLPDSTSLSRDRAPRPVRTCRLLREDHVGCLQYDQDGSLENLDESGSLHQVKAPFLDANLTAALFCQRAQGRVVETSLRLFENDAGLPCWPMRMHPWGRIADFELDSPAGMRTCLRLLQVITTMLSRKYLLFPAILFLCNVGSAIACFAARDWKRGLY